MPEHPPEGTLSVPRRPLKPLEPPPDDPFLTRASITFHTNDEDKNNDTRLHVSVTVDEDRTTVAQIVGYFNRFPDHSDVGPFTLPILEPVRREILKKTGRVYINITPPPDSYLIATDTWRFNFFLDLFFADGGHLIARASRLELNLNSPAQSFGIH